MTGKAAAQAGKTNYHTHTAFCDGADSPAVMADSAYKHGLTALGFSAHARHPCRVGGLDSPAPIGAGVLPPADDWHIAPSDYGKYVDEIARLAREYAGRMDVRCGFEADYIPGIAAPSDPFYRATGAQYVIGSVHYIVHDDGYFTVDGPAAEVRGGVASLFGGDARAAVCEYFALQREMLRTGGFEIWAHPDLFRKRNGALHLFDENDSWYRSEIKAAATEAAHSGVIAEINTGGIARGALDDVYPSAQFLALLHDAGVRVMINSDAHRAKDIACAFGRAEAAARMAGYTDFAVIP